jgi:hypothetical protein
MEPVHLSEWPSGSYSNVPDSNLGTATHFASYSSVYPGKFLIVIASIHNSLSVYFVTV